MTTKRPVGRPPSGLPKRVRRNLNIQRDNDFDQNLNLVMETFNLNQTESVKKAIEIYAHMAKGD